MQVLCATKQEVRNLNRKDLKSIEQLSSTDRENLTYYIYDCVAKYGEEAAVKGLFVDGILVGAIFTAQYENIRGTEIPKQYKSVDRQDIEIIHAIVVGKRYEGKGYGSILIENISADCKNRGKTLLYADMSRESLFGFYTKNGFDRVLKLLVVKKL